MRSFIRGIFAPTHLAPSIEEHAAPKGEVEALRKDLQAHYTKKAEAAPVVSTNDAIEQEFRSFWLLDYFQKGPRPSRTHKEIDELLDLILSHLKLRDVIQPGTTEKRVLEPVKPAKKTRARR